MFYGTTFTLAKLLKSFNFRIPSLDLLLITNLHKKSIATIFYAIAVMYFTY